MTTLTPGQLAQQHNRTADGRYAEGWHADPGSLDLGPEPDGGHAVTCPRCGGPWGSDETCAHCTDVHGDPRPHDQPGPVSLDDPKEVARAAAAQWGEVNVAPGSRTPWGEADYVTPCAPGVVFVATPGHGGYKLSPQRNRAIPAPLRNNSGWYEEDAESAIVAMFHPDAMAHLGDTDEQIVANATRSVINWFPDQYEQATKQTIPFGQSSEKDKADWEAKTAGQPKLYTSHATEDADYPGVVIVTTRTGDGAFTRHMIPLADYQAADANRQHGAARIDPLLPASAIEVPKHDRKPAAKPAVTAISTDHLSTAQAARARADLSKRWRAPDGTIFTEADRIAAGLYNGKTAHTDASGKTTYYLKLTQGNSLIQPVSKAVWDAYGAADDRTESDLALAEYRRKKAALDRVQTLDHGYRNRDEHTRKLDKAEREANQALNRFNELREAEAATREPQRLADAAADKATLDAAYAQLKARG